MSLVASELLAANLLSGVAIMVVGASTPAPGGRSHDSSAGAVVDGCARLGSRVVLCEHAHEHDGAVAEAAMDRAVAGAVADAGGLDMLVVDGAASFASGGLHACLDGAWNATRAVVNVALLPAGRGGRVVYLAPAPSAGERADAARAGLENLARTLSIEWARHRITVVAIALGDATTPGEAAALTAYLASPAGAYFSGAQLDLRGV